MAVGHSVDPARWSAETDRLMDRIAGRFTRVETRRRARRFIEGLLAELPVKNCWTLAEHSGDPDPHAMQYFLARASWDTDGVRDDLRDYVTGRLEDPDAVLVFDETGHLKKGEHTVGVQRQYTGTAGRIENAQVAVYLVYAAARGHAMIDRELYLPSCWVEDPDRLAEAGVPEEIEFATKPALATGMLTRALHAGVNARWVAADEVYGADPGLRAECELAGLGYVLAVGCDRRIPTALGPVRADVVAAELPRHAWQRLSAGPGAKGERVYEWAWIDHTAATLGADPGAADDPLDSRRWSLLVRRHPRTGELAFYRCYSPDLVPLRELVRVAGRRWAIEEAFQTGKGLTGLDQHQVRRWTSWQRWTLLVMLAHALLTVIAADALHDDQNRTNGVIALTRNEIRRLFVRLLIEPGRDLICPLAWSRWRREHQHRARTSHYAQRGDDQRT